MKKKENNKGITLIALVITIIIMIILVAVSVALVVKGDLFGNAQEGTEKTSIEAEKEQLTEYVYGQYRENADKKVEVNLEEVKTILNSDKDKFKGDAKIEGEKLTVTGNSGEVYTVNKNGVIKNKSSEDKLDDSEAFKFENGTLSNFTLNKDTTASEKDYNDCKVVFNPDDVNLEKDEDGWNNAVYFIDKNGTEWILESYVDSICLFDETETYNYYYVIEPHGDDFNKKGWCLELRDGHLNYEYLTEENYPIFEGFKFSSDYAYTEDDISRMNEWYADLFVKVENN